MYDPALSAEFLIGAAVLIVLLLPIYFLPAILGRKKRDWAAIFVLNLFLGWTFLGWVLTLVWALKHDAPTQGGR